MERAALVKSEPNVADLEKKINCGQIEEVLIQARNELSLSRKILEWKSGSLLKHNLQLTNGSGRCNFKKYILDYRRVLNC